MSPYLVAMSASAAAQAIQQGAVKSEDLVRACLDRIESLEPSVQAWAFLDKDHALQQARLLDAARAEGKPCGPLHGIPVGIKDVIDTADMPTEDGCGMHAGRMPLHDATVVSKLRAAGAVILGKTVTTELATYAPGKTRNPHNLAHTPGGSSSGSAAAVACGMVPLALGTQTNGSVIRPAAFCGVYGYKPTAGWVPRQGVLKTSRTLDTVGLFARHLEDLALCAEQMVGHDVLDPATQPRARPPLQHVLSQAPFLPPRIAFVKTSRWDRADAETREAFGELTRALGPQCEEVALGDSMAEVWQVHQTIMEAEMGFLLRLEWEKGRGRLSPQLQAQLERGRATTALEYQHALNRVAPWIDSLEELFNHFDAILTPSAPGVAPGLETTGDPVFCTPWTLLGMPALNLPLMRSAGAMPLGAQLVGKCGADARLLQTAQWLSQHVSQQPP